MVEIKSMAQLNSMLMSDAKYKLLVNRVKKIISDLLASVDTPDDIKAILKDRVLLEDLSEKDKREALRNQSTAMIPNPKCKLVMVGSFGSVWIDCILRGKPTRIAINPENGKYTLA